MRKSPAVVLVILRAVTFIALLDATISNIALASIIEAIDASIDKILRVFNSNVFSVLLATLGCLPIRHRKGERPEDPRHRAGFAAG